MTMNARCPIQNISSKEQWYLDLPPIPKRCGDSKYVVCWVWLECGGACKESNEFTTHNYDLNLSDLSEYSKVLLNQPNRTRFLVNLINIYTHPTSSFLTTVSCEPTPGVAREPSKIVQDACVVPLQRQRCTA